MTSLIELQSVLNKEFQEPMSDLIARSNPLLAGLPKRSLATDRIWLRHKSASDHDAEPILDGATVTAGNPKSTRAAGVLDWSTYVAKFGLPKRLLGQVQNNPEMVGQLFRDEIMDAVKDLADRISSDLFKGDTANGIVGLKSILSGTNTYAGIDRSVAANAYWRGLVVDAAAGDLSTSRFYDAEETYFNRNYGPLFDGSAVVFTTKRLQRKYAELFETIDYSSLATAHFVNQANSSGQFGRSGVGFQGAPFVPHHLVDSTGDTAATDRLYVLRPGSMFLANLQPNDDPDVARIQHIDARNAQNIDGLNVQIEILGNVGERIEGYVKTYVQLVCPAPSEAGVAVINVANAL